MVRRWTKNPLSAPPEGVSQAVGKKDHSVAKEPRPRKRPFPLGAFGVSDWPQYTPPMSTHPKTPWLGSPRSSRKRQLPLHDACSSASLRRAFLSSCCDFNGWTGRLVPCTPLYYRPQVGCLATEETLFPMFFHLVILNTCHPACHYPHLCVAPPLFVCQHFSSFLFPSSPTLSRTSIKACCKNLIRFVA